MPQFNIRQTHSILPAVQHLLDGMMIAFTLPLSQWLLQQPMNDRTWAVSLTAAAIFFVVGELCGLYQGRKGRTPDIEIASIALAWSASYGALSTLGFMTRVGDTFSRSSIVVWFIVGLLFVTLGRMLVRALFESLIRRGIGTRRCAIAGLNSLGIQVAKNALEQPDCGLHLVGFFDDRGDGRQSKLDESLPKWMGGLDAMVDMARQGQIDTVLVTLPMRAEERIRSILNQLGDTTAAVYIVPDFFVFELLHSRWSEIGGLPVVSVFETPLYGIDGWIKRGVDLTLSILGVLALLPVFFVVALAVKLSSSGPVFFRQKRYGLDGREILVWKFRSMRTCDNGPVVKQAQKNDPRITKVGAFLRKTSLDELPQLFNVIEGTMSLVGPRPHASAHNEHYRHLIRGYMLRHKVRPGITGLAQVEGSRGETETVEKMQRRVELDHRYIREWTLWLDIQILFRTFWVVWKQENAH